MDGGPEEDDSSGYRLGLLVTLTGSLILATAGVIIRQLEAATDWQIIFYRSVSLLGGLGLLFLCRHRDRTLSELRKTWRAALWVGPLQGITSILFVFSITRNSVANAVLPMGAVPLIAAALGWLFLRERLDRVTILTLAIAGCGIVAMALGGISEGTKAGTALALMNAFALASYLVFVRRASRKTGGDMVTAVMAGAAFSAVVSAYMTSSFHIGSRDLAIMLGWGGVVQCGGLALIMGVRHLRAAEVSLMVVAEAVFGPLLAGLILAEMPGLWTIVGGAVVVAAVVFWALSRLRQEHLRARGPS